MKLSSLYNLLEVKRKHSVLKSVFYNDGTYSIETYDETLENAIYSGRDRFIKAENYIERKIKEHMECIGLDIATVTNYSMYGSTVEYIIDRRD